MCDWKFQDLMTRGFSLCEQVVLPKSGYKGSSIDGYRNVRTSSLVVNQSLVSPGHRVLKTSRR